MQKIDWNKGTWFNQPPNIKYEDNSMLITTAFESDLWRSTSYGFIHDSAHGLLIDFPDKSAVEVSFILDYEQQFDQAGVLVRADSEHWIKSGIEFADGTPQIGAVVTDIKSDWSVAPINEWYKKEVTIRTSRDGDAVTVRARCGEENWRLVRLAPINPLYQWKAGPFCASPTREGLVVRFMNFEYGEADKSLH